MAEIPDNKVKFPTGWLPFSEKVISPPQKKNKFHFLKSGYLVLEEIDGGTNGR